MDDGSLIVGGPYVLFKVDSIVVVNHFSFAAFCQRRSPMKLAYTPGPDMTKRMSVRRSTSGLVRLANTASTSRRQSYSSAARALSQRSATAW